MTNQFNEEQFILKDSIYFKPDELAFGDLIYTLAKKELGLEMYGPSKNVAKIKLFLDEKYDFEIPKEAYSDTELEDLLAITYELLYKK